MRRTRSKVLRSPHVAVSIDLRTPDPDLEGVSETEARGHGVITSPKLWQITKDVLKAAKEPTNKWNTAFIISCSLAVFIDPLYCYIHIIAASRNCYYRDEKLFWAYLGLRSATDVFYAMDIFYFLRSHRAHNKLNGKTSEICRKREQKRREDKSFMQARIHKLLPILLCILVALPIPEGLLLASKCRDWPKSTTHALFMFTPFQYLLRIYHIYGSLRHRPIIETGIRGRWLKAFLDFLPFIIASHLFGAMWYRLAIQRQLDCWKSNCKINLPDSCVSSYSMLECSNSHMQPHVDQKQISIWENSCPIKEDNPYIFDFGIYRYAFQSNVTVSTHICQRMLLSFWWALRNLSSVGSNLQTSTSMMEIFFSILISTSGILLFLVYLNARVQEFHERSKQLKQKEKKRWMILDVDLWLSRNNIQKDPNTEKKKNQALKIENEKDKNLRDVIMENIDKLEVNKDIDLQNILSIIPLKDKKQIIYLLCLASLNKVPVCLNMNEKALKVICDHLKPAIYTNDHSIIVQEGKPLKKMIFITQGIAWTETSSGSSTTECLKKGDVVGGELLDWAFKLASFSDLPISTRTVTSQGKVEALAISADELKSVVSKFCWHFTNAGIGPSCRVGDLELQQWERLAFSSLREIWCRYHGDRLAGRDCLGQICSKGTRPGLAMFKASS